MGSWVSLGGDDGGSPLGIALEVEGWVPMLPLPAEPWDEGVGVDGIL
jgi:hypothetical protein